MTSPTTATDGLVGKAVRSTIRNAVQAAITAAVTYAAHYSLHIDGADLATKVMPEVFVGYGTVVRSLEHKYHWVGYLLGVPKG